MMAYYAYKQTPLSINNELLNKPEELNQNCAL